MHVFTTTRSEIWWFTYSLSAVYFHPQYSFNVSTIHLESLRVTALWWYQILISMNNTRFISYLCHNDHTTASYRHIDLASNRFLDAISLQYGCTGAYGYSLETYWLGFGSNINISRILISIHLWLSVFYKTLSTSFFVRK